MFGPRCIHLDWMVDSVDTLRRDEGAPWVGNINIAMVTGSIASCCNLTTTKWRFDWQILSFDKRIKSTTNEMNI